MRGLPEDPERQTQHQKHRSWVKKATAAFFSVVLVMIGITIAESCFLTPASNRRQKSSHLSPEEEALLKSRCPYMEKIAPQPGFENSTVFLGDEYKKHSVKVWGDMIRIPTQSYDLMGPIDEDPRWQIFAEFEKYLNATFPVFTERAELEHVNTYGLVYTLTGSDLSKKPILLTGHQDVVPVPDNTVSRWTHPPFSGHFDGQYMWGRGSADCKNTVSAIFEALESLCSQDFHPKRTVVVALGFDEEASGYVGARNIGKYLENRFGKDSFLMLLDEGGAIVEDVYGVDLALPDTGEKGRVNVVVDLETTGGHSSVPPPHTSVGIMSELITTLESSPFPLQLEPSSPFYTQLQCMARFSNSSMPNSLRADIVSLAKDPEAKNRVLELQSRDLYTKYLFSTSQAADIFNGGSKSNALPEQVSAQINYRIDVGSSVKEVQDKVEGIVRQIAHKYGLCVKGFGTYLQGFDPIPKGGFTLSVTDALEPAPVTDVTENPTWALLAGTIRHVFEDDGSVLGSANREIVVSPSLTTANTDTRHYWDLTPNIYRFNPVRMNYFVNIHAVDERVLVDAHLETVAFYYDFVQNADCFDK
ncbi:hypothetical protein BRETT_002575 [Brettanomyces bruxellensis]|uniref:Peptidase M20 dimerisation domain-containing protein n=1 Tax=Dekkera bruxellensis TaxID=5007 RepID=A0A871RAY4_DEKBR|nr:uncharacterized protein BRETT_002575 [Brettanomyces bruxellensis]QOU22396.1 hypothetical protein BRETT_002575 [Brettanomyces bruxellensis]